MNFPFGKYKGESIEKVLIEDPKYFLWFKSLEYLDDKLKSYVEELYFDNREELFPHVED